MVIGLAPPSAHSRASGIQKERAGIPVFVNWVPAFAGTSGKDIRLISMKLV
jgi:hypothetical protein